MGLFSSYFVGNLTSSSWSPWKGMLQWNCIEIFCVCEVDNHKKRSIKYSGKDYCDFLYVVVTINNHPRWKLTYGLSLVRGFRRKATGVLFTHHSVRPGWIIWATFCSILSIFPPTGPDRSAGGYDLYHHTWSVAHASTFSRCSSVAEKTDSTKEEEKRSSWGATCKTNTPKVQKIKNIYVCCLHYGSANVKYMLLA